MLLVHALNKGRILTIGTKEDFEISVSWKVFLSKSWPRNIIYNKYALILLYGIIKKNSKVVIK